MKKIYLCFLSLILLLSACTGTKTTLTKYNHRIYDLFGTVTTVVGYCESPEEFAEKISYLEEELTLYHQLYDIYNPYEGMNNLYTLNQQAAVSPVVVDQRLFSLLEWCKAEYEPSGKQVNIAMGSVLSLWHQYREDGQENPESASLPPMSLLVELNQHTNFDDVILDKENLTVFFADPELQLDVGAVGKGYAVEQIGSKMVGHFLIGVGGNIYATGAKDGQGTPWTIGVKDPLTPDGDFLCTLEITSGAVVSSGDYQQYYLVDGQSYHHIIDETTLMPTTNFSGVTIITPDGGIGDLLSTSLFSLTLEEGKKVLENYPEAQAIWVTPQGEVIHSYQ